VTHNSFTLSPQRSNAAAALWHNPAGDEQLVPFALSSSTVGRGSVAMGKVVTVESMLLKPIDESVADVAYKKVALAYITTHKLRALEVAGVRVLRVWNFYAPKSQVMFDYQDARPHVVSWLGLGVYYLSLPLAVLGAVARRRRVATNAPFIGFIVTATIAVMVTFANGRYRVEGDLALAILAAFGVVELAARRRARPLREVQ
jgi:hypothetical protein